MNGKQTEYSEIRKELKKQRESVQYFTREFFRDFMDARRELSRQAQKNDIKRTERGGIVYLDAFRRVYESDFYRLNGGAYCVLLELIMG